MKNPYKKSLKYFLLKPKNKIANKFSAPPLLKRFLPFKLPQKPGKQGGLVEPLEDFQGGSPQPLQAARFTEPQPHHLYT